MGEWLLNADNTINSTGLSYGPYSGWTAVGLSVGPGSTGRVLWSNTDGSASTWSIANNNTATYSPLFGPF